MFHFQNQQIFKIYFKKLWIKLNKKKNTDSSQGGRGTETTVLLDLFTIIRIASKTRVARILMFN